MSQLDAEIMERLSGSGEFLPRNHVRKETPMSVSSQAEEALRESIELLKPYADELGEGIFTSLVAAGKGDDESVEKLADSVVGLQKAEHATELSKSADRENLRQAVRKARAKVEREYLAQVSPVTVRKMEQREQVEEARHRANFGDGG